MNQSTKNFIILAGVSILMVALFSMASQQTGPKNQWSYSDFISHVESGSVMSVKIKGQKIEGITTNNANFLTYSPSQDEKLVTLLIDKGVSVNVEPPEEASWLGSFMLSWLPVIVLVAVWLFFMRQMQGGGGKAMSFGRSRARMITQEQGRVTFDDVAGVDEAKEELQEVVDFLSNPKKFTRLGGRIPKGVLLVGPPGTGKTLLARAVAGEAGVPFFSISGSDFVEMFVGVGASRVRDLFVQGKKNAPCLIFIDEIDAVGRQRGAGLGGGHDEREQTLNQLLVEMDGFESNEGVILIAATNRPDVLDPALLRPGRFDRQVVVPTPDFKGRERILQVHSNRTPLGKDVNLEILAKGTPGFSGADLENLVNEAALQAAKLGKDRLSMADFEFAKDKVLMGRERRSLILSDEERKTTAYHEAGHALVAKLIKGTDPVHKVSIIPRGRALGVTMQLPEGDRHGYSRRYLEGNLSILLAGRAAEMIIFDEITTGAGNDIERATKMARKMICEWGMSDVIGTIAVGDKNDEVFLGRDMMHSRNYSEETARLVDAEVKAMIENALKRTLDILNKHVDILHKVSETLLDKETISGEDIDNIMNDMGVPPLTPTPKLDAAHNPAAGKLPTEIASNGSGEQPSENEPGKTGANENDEDNFTLEDK